LAKLAVEEHGVRERRACRYLGISRTAYRHQPQKPGDEEIIQLLKDIAKQKPRWGFKKMVNYLRNKGYGWNHKKIHRIYTMFLILPLTTNWLSS